MIEVERKTYTPSENLNVNAVPLRDENGNIIKHYIEFDGSGAAGKMIKDTVKDIVKKL